MVFQSGATAPGAGPSAAAVSEAEAGPPSTPSISASGDGLIGAPTRRRNDRFSRTSELDGAGVDRTGSVGETSAGSWTASAVRR